MPTNRYNRTFRLLFPALLFSFFTGALVGFVIVLFKFCANLVVRWSGMAYSAIRSHPVYGIFAVLFLLAAAGLYWFVFRNNHNLRGGGIPTSIGILRGLIPFNWVHNVIGVFGLSLLTFLIGVPLGTEGPSVQIGTAIGRGAMRVFAKKSPAWDCHIMTGGACAGFTAATDAPISGMMFAIEEAHQRITPMIIIVSTASVTASKIVCTLLSPLFGLNTYLFQPMTLPPFDIRGLGLPILIAVVVGLFSVLFLNYYTILKRFWNTYVKRLPEFVRIFLVLLLTFALGLLSDSFTGSGHHLIEELIEGHMVWYLLFAYLAVRATMMIFANNAGITGGMFLPIMALGAILSSVIGGILISFTPLGTEYYSLVVVLGITSCIAGMMKMPLTAIVFAVEAFSAHENIIPVLLAACISYYITVFFHVKSINDHVLENRLHELHKDTKPVVADIFLTVQENAYAVGKQVRDIFWPANTFMLSVQHASDRKIVMDERGDKTLRVGDRLHIRYSTYDEEDALRALLAIVGDQKYELPIRDHIL